VLREEGLLDRARIYATDVSEIVLAAARRAVSEEWPEDLPARYREAGGTPSLDEYYQRMGSAMGGARCCATHRLRGAQLRHRRLVQRVPPHRVPAPLERFGRRCAARDLGARGQPVPLRLPGGRARATCRARADPRRLPGRAAGGRAVPEVP
jgi:hypothetical protein